MLISFPALHPAKWSGPAVDGLQFFDPGLEAESFDGAFRPENLPLDSRSATALINDCINFGEQFKDPGEMAYFGAQTTDDFYEGSSMSIRAQLERSFDDGQGTKQEREERDARSKAQFILLLAWFFEERMMELDKLQKGIKNSWKAMDVTLGVEDEDRLDNRVESLGNAQSHTGGVMDGQTIPFPWKRVVEALPAFLPEDAILVCDDADIIETWKEHDIEFSDTVDGMPAATLPAWKFAGRRNEPKELPTALKKVTVALIK